MNKLIVFGCSFTQGSGCLPDEPYTLKYKKFEDDLIWPEILAKQLNLKLLNFGEAGKSNGRIIDTIIKNFDLIQPGDVVIIEKTFSHRFEVSPINAKIADKLFTITPRSYDTLIEEGYNKEEASALIMASVINDNPAFKEKTDNMFNFLKKIITDKGVKNCIVWNLTDYDTRYEIIQSVDENIMDPHWSYNGHKMFAITILAKLLEKKLI
jgi:hypothetical protein